MINEAFVPGTFASTMDDYAQANNWSILNHPSPNPQVIKAMCPSAPQFQNLNPGTATAEPVISAVDPMEPPIVPLSPIPAPSSVPTSDSESEGFQTVSKKKRAKKQLHLPVEEINKRVWNRLQFHPPTFRKGTIPKQPQDAKLILGIRSLNDICKGDNEVTVTEIDKLVRLKLLIINQPDDDPNQPDEYDLTPLGLLTLAKDPDYQLLTLKVKIAK